MKSWLLKFMVIFALINATGARTEDDSPAKYVNPRFGYELKYPNSLVPEKEPEDGVATGSRVFRDASGKVLLQTNAHFLHGATLDSEYKAALGRYGDTVQYKLKKDVWFVVSGVKDGDEYYYKYFVQKGNWASFYFHYPAAESKKWNPVVEKVAKEFKPFLDGDFDRLDR